MAVMKKVSLAVIYDIILINIWRNQFSVDIDIAPGFINTKYECMRPTLDIPKHNRKLLSLLRLLERKRQLDSEDKRSLSYRHAISAIKVRLDQPKSTYLCKLCADGKFYRHIHAKFDPQKKLQKL